MKEKLESICFFLDTGRTFTFRDVELVTDNETVWVIRYKAMSDGHGKTATFYKSRVVGVAKLAKGNVAAPGDVAEFTPGPA